MRLLQEWRMCVLLHTHTHTQVSLSDHWECLWNELPRRRHHNHHVIQRHRLPTCTDFHSYFFLFVSLSRNNEPPPRLQEMFDISCHSPCGKSWCPPRCWAALLTAHSAATNTLTTTAAASWLESQLKSSHYVCLNGEKKKISTRRTWVLLLMVTLQCKTAVHANYTRCLFSII